jgi:hypothetical protein
MRCRVDVGVAAGVSIGRQPGVGVRQLLGQTATPIWLCAWEEPVGLACDVAFQDAHDL